MRDISQIEPPENLEAETTELNNPIKSIRVRINGAPSITKFTILRRYRNRWEIHLHDTDTTITVGRVNGENAAQALRRYLTA